jgi:hypothetical protein
MTRGAAEKGRDDGAGTALHRHRRGAAEGGADPLRRRARRGDRAGSAGQAARAGHLGQRRPGRAGQGGGEEPVRPRRASSRSRARGSGRPGRGAAGRRVVDLISLARKAGRRWPATRRSRTGSPRKRPAVLIQASDGSERGKSKLSTPQGGAFGCLTASDELGLAFGRETVIHAALAAGGLTTCCRGSRETAGPAQNRTAGPPAGKERRR